MKCIFWGTCSFAAEVLRYVCSLPEITISAVITREDKERGRGKQVSFPPVKEFLENHSKKIPYLQPKKIASEETLSWLNQFQPDLFIVVSYGKIIPQQALDIPKIGSVNVHPSLLPKYRGPSPIRSAMLDGEKETGVCIIEVVQEMDAGDILAEEKISIGKNTSFGELREQLLELSKKVLHKSIKDILSAKKIVGKKQEHSLATYTKKITSDQSFIEWNHSAEKVLQLILALNPYPGAKTFIEIKGEKKLLKIFSAEISSEKGSPKEVLQYSHKEGIVVACKEFSIKITCLQIEGKRKMQASEFVNGFSSVKFI